MENITFKQVLDDEGNFKHLELWQGHNVIKISLSHPFAAGKHSFVWDHLKESIDAIKTSRKGVEALQDLAEMTHTTVAELLADKAGVR